MKIIITGSLGHISKPLAQELIKKGHDITVVTSKPDRKAEIDALGARAAIGSVEDPDFLTTTFENADLVYSMIPPGNFMDQHYDVMSRVRAIMGGYRQALSNAGIRRVIHLSSIGAR